MDEGTKHDDGKLRFDLLPPEALEEVARVFTVGAAKYDDRNWEKGIRFGRVFGAVMRHMWSWWRGEEVDQETEISHLAHAATNIFFLLAFTRRGMIKLDDRPKNDTWGTA